MDSIDSAESLKSFALMELAESTKLLRVVESFQSLKTPEILESAGNNKDFDFILKILSTKPTILFARFLLDSVILSFGSYFDISYKSGFHRSSQTYNFSIRKCSTCK
ncbi:hypothetical protein CCY99_07545 [Helicobacter sp. 16-1353]|uniref:hypothetical protein n=1 Tax=Helicobacter sp. 16-1353 TaxID=2004996 RepID=UPI000DCE1FF6|nr:hypothetical protein [Helicobacter sp. 16-1353]RAX52237.1 hypothetical protein CCY99_07545 [Helicobacter sp. 16-1353]